MKHHEPQGLALGEGDIMLNRRQIVETRQSLAQTIADTFLPLEQTADATAIAAHRCVADMLEQRIMARLGVTDGHPAISLVHEGCQHAFKAQAAFREAHALFPQMLDDLGLFYAPECPGMERIDEPAKLRAVA